MRRSENVADFQRDFNVRSTQSEARNPRPVRNSDSAAAAVRGSRMVGVFASFLLAGLASAQRLEGVGVIGNSGVAGPELIRVVPTEQPSGVYVAPDSTVWIDGGDAILHVTFDGRLIESHPLTPVCEKVNSWSFAALDETLYLFALIGKTASARVGDREFRSRMALCALPLTAAAVPRVVRPFPDISDWRGGVLAAQPLGDRLVLAKGRADGVEEEMVVCTLDPSDGRLAEFLQPGARTISGLALDSERGRLYVGGTWPDAWSPEIVAYDLAGKEVHRSMALQTPANPTQFRGIVSLVGDAIWEGAWYGHLGRWSLDLDTAPGTVWTWGLEFHYPCQLVAASGRMGTGPLRAQHPSGRSGKSDRSAFPAAASPAALVMSETDNQHTYLLRWDAAASTVTLGKRIGSLAEVTSLAISDDGWVAVGTGGRTLWWKWQDDARDPPRAGNHQAGGVSGYFHDGDLVALLPGSDKRRSTAITFRPHAGRGMSQPDYGQFTPFARPAGLARTVGDPAGPHDYGWAYATDAAKNSVWRAPVEGRRGVPIASQWKQLDSDVCLSKAGDVAALTGGRLALADAGAVVLARVAGDKLVEERRMVSWGPASEQTFGPAIRLAAEGSQLLVADTPRHRVLWFDAQSGDWLAQFGTTDVAGAGADALNQPAAVAISGPQAVVYDAGNQRIMKLELLPRLVPRMDRLGRRRFGQTRDRVSDGG